MNVLVTGGAGFIGGHLVRHLRDEGHRVRVLDPAPADGSPDDHRRGDVRDAGAVREAMQGVDAVVHLAAVHRDDVRPGSLYDEVNVAGTRRIVEAATREGVTRIVFTSTAAVYGLDASHPDERAPPRPFNAYSRSKLAAEEVLRDWRDGEEGRSLLIVRPSAVYGEGNHRGNVATLIRQIAKDRFVMVGSGENRKSLAYVGNLARFLCWALRRELPFSVVNYCDKPDLTMNELVALIRERTGKDGGQPIRVPYWLGLLGGKAFDVASRLSSRTLPFSSVRVRKFCAETTLSTDRLESTDFERPYSMEEGLRKMVVSTLERMS